MSEIEFKSVPNEEIESLKMAFDYISSSKSDGSFNEDALAKVMGAKVTNYFVNPAKEEADEMLKQWKANPNAELPWDFGSWFDTIESAELIYLGLDIDQNGNGKLLFEQLACPSGGLDASEQIIKAFGGEVTSNNGI
ncbi:hypothetical protein [Bacterioplanoides sp.]|uniref:hypothetical protein n=1 Tax=Bacterioplanoides sp. TaxID=2066072 RepID=UPI003B005A21